MSYQAQNPVMSRVEQGGRILAGTLLCLCATCARTTGPVGAPAPTQARSVAAPAVTRPTEDTTGAPSFARVDQVIEAGIADHATPGAAVAVGVKGKLVRLRGYGQLDWAPGSAAVNDSTLYDLASLSKVIATTTAVMLTVDAGKLDINKRVGEYLPEWDALPEHRPVTVKQLLIHESGLPPFLPFWRDTRGREAFLKKIGGTPLQNPPGTKYVYSDLNFILLGLMVERRMGRPLDVLLQQKVWGPLGMRDTRYNPLLTAPVPPDTDCTIALAPHAGSPATAEVPPASSAAAPVFARIASTEVDTVYRHIHVRGIVHDENACAIGGVSGHAGLFSSARDLAVFAQMMLNGGSYNGVRVLKAETIHHFTSRQSPISTRGLGWDMAGEGSFLPAGFSASAFGHTGFTGTSIYIDPERNLFVVLLTNRVDPTRDNTKISPVRRAVARAVQEATS